MFMSRVLARTYNKHNTRPSNRMVWIYTLASIFAFFYGMGGLEQEVNLTTQQFWSYAGAMLGGLFSGALLFAKWICND
jgi:hypothetical protein